MQVLTDRLFRRVGLTRTNFFGVCRIAGCIIKCGEEGSLVSLICDAGGRYTSTYYNHSLPAEKGIDIEPYREVIERFLYTGIFKAI